MHAISGLRRLALLIATTALLAAAAASTASADTVVVLNGTGVTGSTVGGGAIINLGTTRAVSCTTYSSRVDISTQPPGTFPIQIGSNLDELFSTCRVTGGLAAIVSCANSPVNVTTQSTLDTTPISLTGFSCQIALTSAPTCNVRVTGSMTASYDNTTQVLTTGTQSLTSSASTCTATFPNGAVTITNALRATFALAWPSNLRMLASF
jgi:hypothetical protein